MPSSSTGSGSSPRWRRKCTSLSSSDSADICLARSGSAASPSAGPSCSAASGFTSDGFRGDTTGASPGPSQSLGEAGPTGEAAGSGRSDIISDTCSWRDACLSARADRVDPPKHHMGMAGLGDTRSRLQNSSFPY